MEFIVQGKPIAKGRPRLGKYKTYTPDRTKIYEEKVKIAFIGAEHIEPLKGPVKVDIEFYFKIPKSYTKKKQAQIKAGLEAYTKKPDLDNLAKTITDALNGLAYEDDSQIVEMNLKKQYGQDEMAYIKITKVNKASTARL